MLLDSPICDFGWKMPSHTLPDLDGKPVSLEKSYGAHGLLIAFICNHCPYVQAIIGRLVADANALIADGVNVVAVMPNDFVAYPDDHPREMKKFAAQHQFTFPYLPDESQTVARAFDAVCTPDFFGFNRDGALQYRGRLDNTKMNDAKMNDATDRHPELLEAMRMVAATGKGPAEQTPSIGCSIKWKA